MLMSNLNQRMIIIISSKIDYICIMKHILIGLIGLTLLATSCKKEKKGKGNQQAQTNEIVGTWYEDSSHTGLHGKNYPTGTECINQNTHSKLIISNDTLHHVRCIIGTPIETKVKYTLKGNYIHYFDDSSYYEKPTKSQLKVYDYFETDTLITWFSK